MFEQTFVVVDAFVVAGVFVVVVSDRPSSTRISLVDSEAPPEKNIRQPAV